MKPGGGECCHLRVAWETMAAGAPQTLPLCHGDREQEAATGTEQVVPTTGLQEAITGGGSGLGINVPITEPCSISLPTLHLVGFHFTHSSLPSPCSWLVLVLEGHSAATKGLK